MKIKKLCTYENIQLENLDGTRPRGEQARLAKTFTDVNYNLRFAPAGVGVIIESKNPDEKMSTFVIPFANIPFIVCDPTEEQNDNGSPDKQSALKRSKEVA